MAEAVRVPRGQTRFASAALAAFAVVTVAAGLAAWHKYQLLAGPPAPGPYVDNPLVEVDTYFRNLMGWRTGLLLAALLQFSIWLAHMRDLADVLWRQGQRRRRAWLVFGWVIPVGQLFIPKMFINDLWAASRPKSQRRRGHPLLTAWWLSVLVAANAYNDAPKALKKAVTASQARHALRQIMFSDGLDICAAALSIAVVWQLIRRLESATLTAMPPAEVCPTGQAKS
ncbi:DUF4328 domain-containing protein [Streptomyces sp. NBC_01799]|uniref:DUF4328 domain-containing protein n=1 Tax=Streptomyces sp. NBC_01800 TaxID=2975945 RepID=UPI002DD87242|nr:DUF4328 domain-containing protein [Streptomyces sp. NBC_01800]WSA72338.1 DUF4328 domain-containing protein [Streptomyces sp. NBC_01800]WSA80854.1 DUF4328 domain-containing protein [Streptomyces sp. NBC_01799]